MAKNKLFRYAELPTLDNVINKPEVYKDHWASGYFGNSKPIVVELGSGKAEYTLGLAERYPDKNFIAIDVKGARLWVGAKSAIEHGLDNTAFVRMYIEMLTDVFGEKELDEIWIPFADPFTKKPNRRLVSPMFLERYRPLLKDDAKIHFKTDDTDYYEYALTVLEEKKCTIHHNNSDIYTVQEPDESVYIQTTYELKHLALGKTIKYICFSL